MRLYSWNFNWRDFVLDTGLNRAAFVYSTRHNFRIKILMKCSIHKRASLQNVVPWRTTWATTTYNRGNNKIQGASWWANDRHLLTLNTQFQVHCFFVVSPPSLTALGPQLAPIAGTKNFARNSTARQMSFFIILLFANFFLSLFYYITYDSSSFTTPGLETCGSDGGGTAAENG